MICNRVPSNSRHSGHILNDKEPQTRQFITLLQLPIEFRKPDACVVEQDCDRIADHMRFHTHVHDKIGEGSWVERNSISPHQGLTGIPGYDGRKVTFINEIDKGEQIPPHCPIVIPQYKAVYIDMGVNQYGPPRAHTWQRRVIEIFVGSQNKVQDEDDNFIRQITYRQQ